MTLHGTKLGRLLIGFAFAALLLTMPVVIAAQEKIVFSSNREGVSNQEIYVMNTDGSDQKRLTLQHGV